MDPVTGALISAGGSILGGILGKPKNEYVVPNYQKIRTKAEAAGFNPLTALAMAPGQVVQSQNFMGSAIADAGLALADGLNTKRKEQGALAKLAEENDKLREKVQNMTLRPKVGGVYAQREAIPSVSQAVGGSNASGVGASVSATAAARTENSPLGGAVVGPGDNNLTGPQLSVAQDVPAFRAFGHDFYGTGAFSTAQQFEDALGEGELLQGITFGVLGADAVLNEANKPYQRYIGQPFVNGVKRVFGRSLPGWDNGGADRSAVLDTMVNRVPDKPMKKASPSYWAFPPPRNAWPKFQLGR